MAKKHSQCASTTADTSSVMAVLSFIFLTDCNEIHNGLDLWFLTTNSDAE